MSLPNIEKLVRPNHDERARQGFVSMLRKHAIIDMRRALKDDYQTRVEPALASRGQRPTDWRGIEAAMQPEPSYRFYSSLRYNAQEMCYLSVQPAVERALPEMIDLVREAAASNPAGGSLRLDPGLELPRYVAALDVHLVPGWVHQEHTVDDVSQGAVVALGGKVFTGQHPFRRNLGVIGESIGAWVKEKYPGFKPRRILDMGTTTGKNLLPYAAIFPEAELHGIDVGAPVLRYAHAAAGHEGIAAHFSQQNAEHTDFPDGYFDLIVSSFFLHEIPVKATRNVLRECHRLLGPGGIACHMELPDEASVDAYENFFWNWDTYNNNEPYYTSFRAEKPLELCAGAGFAPAECFAHLIPDFASTGSEKLRQFVRGEYAAPPHGSGGWFVFGGVRGR
ncbi:MAG: class I SAM-dependent methyltransferase [Sinobacteraceae bacterium]|nr:class I SAM-dependent methyltransferase [Nevskiaceae bacterium]MCP5466503.1 class I SAM-dependent methyltransferase [Nevskiaceae bacterium]